MAIERTQTPPPPAAPHRTSWILRLSRRLPGSSLAQGAGAAALLFALGWAGELVARATFGQSPASDHERYLLVLFPCITGYALGVVPFGVRRALADLAELRPHLRGTEAELDAFGAQLEHHSSRLLRGAIAAGLVVALLTQEAVAQRVSRALLGAGTFRDVVQLSLSATFWITAASGFAVVFANARLFSRIGDARMRVDLFIRSALAPFARVGIRNVGMIAGLLALQFLLAVFGSETVWSPESFGDGDVGSFALGAMFSLAVALLASVLALLQPCLGVRRAIRREKARLRTEVDDRLAGMAPSLPRAMAAGSAPVRETVDLLRLRDRIDAAAEWPFDHLTHVRFAGLVLLPVFSWVASAAIEAAMFGS